MVSSQALTAEELFPCKHRALNERSGEERKSCVQDGLQRVQVPCQHSRRVQTGSQGFASQLPLLSLKSSVTRLHHRRKNRYLGHLIECLVENQRYPTAVELVP